MLLPRKTKFRKSFKGKNRGNATRGTELNFGKYGMKSMGNERITSRQIEAARRAMTRYIKRGGKIWIRVFPHTPVTHKAAEVPMGGGKGALDHYVAKIKAGTIIFEMDGVDEEVAREAIRLAAHKMPMRTKFVAKQTIGEEQ